MLLNLKAISSACHNYWIWINITFQKNLFFWSNPYKIEAMIVSLKKSYETLVTWPYLHYKLSYVIKFCFWRHGKNYDIVTFNLKYLYFKEACIVANLNDMIKIQIMLITGNFKRGGERSICWWTRNDDFQYGTSRFWEKYGKNMVEKRYSQH